MLTREQHMNIALTLARWGLGRTWTNPTVGCVIVKNGEIIARARTADGGRPHAEALALKMAGGAANGSSVYVSLEPCAHHGKTPPCADALVKARVGEVIIGCVDPDSRVAGKGIKILQAAGVKVTVGILEKECREVNAGFFKRVEQGLPYVTLKAATSADGKYLAGNGKPQWVTSETARNHAQLLRAQHDAVITGTGTVLADDPKLDCRLPGMSEFSPVKVVIGESKIPKNANVFSGKDCLTYQTDNLKTVLESLAGSGFTRTLIEAGPQLSNAFLDEQLVDRIIIFKSNHNLGSEAKYFFNQSVFQKFYLAESNEFSDYSMLTYRKI